MTGLLALLWIGAAHAGCDDVLEIALTHAEKSFKMNHADGVEGGAKDAQKSVECVQQLLGASIAARIHRAEALTAHLKGNIQRTDTMLAAMVHADPWLGVSDLVEPAHPLAVRLVYVEERPAGATRPLLWPEQGLLHVDGIPAAIAPSDQPWVYQQLTADGTVVQSAWVDVGEAPPATSGAIGDRARLRSGWRLAGGTLALIGAGMGVGAYTERQRFNRALVAQDPVATRDAESMSNALTVGALVTGASGVALVVVGFTI